jgi:hypothetical protein
MKDLGVNFCLSEENIGQPRDAVCVTKLQELNKVRLFVFFFFDFILKMLCALKRVVFCTLIYFPKECLVATAPELNEKLVGDHTAMIVTSYMKKDELIKWNE